MTWWTRKPIPLKNIAWAFCVGIFLGMVIGCNSTPAEPPLMPMSGTVKVEGQSLAVGWITLYPDETKGNLSTRLPTGEINKDGTSAGTPAKYHKILKVTITQS